MSSCRSAIQQSRRTTARTKQLMGILSAPHSSFTLALSCLFLATSVASVLAVDWVIETVDTAYEAGHYSSIAIDATGLPHIGYWDGFYYDLEYAYRDGSGWHLETVESEGMVGGHASLAVDESGCAHLSCYDSDSQELLYVYWDGSAWNTEIVDTDGQAGFYTSLVLDSSGSPHISYQVGYSYYDLRYAYKDGSGWHVEDVDTDGDTGYSTSIALNDSGYPHISYNDYDDFDLNHAYKDGSGWHVETPDQQGSISWDTSIALDDSGFPHISYHDDAPNYVLKYAYRDGSGWHTETVETGYMGRHNSLSLDEFNCAHIGYYDRGNHDLKYAYRNGSGWHRETVDDAGYAGEYASLAIDSSGMPHISYRGEGKLKYARMPIILDSSFDNGQLVLSWTGLGGTTAYWVYGAENLAWFVPGMSPGYDHRLAIVNPPATTWSSTNGIGDPSSNWAYLVMAVDASEQELDRSNRAGEYDFDVSGR